MDIVGQLPHSRSCNRFVLVVCDYATRYPEAVALQRIDAERIAEELVNIFARVGIPNEILTDQGSNFQSQLFGALHTGAYPGFERRVSPQLVKPRPMPYPLVLAQGARGAQRNISENLGILAMLAS